MAYGLFLVLVIYSTIAGHYDDAVINLGIALIFDPFDTTVRWNDRPIYQRVWLLAHLLILFAGFFWIILN